MKLVLTLLTLLVPVSASAMCASPDAFVLPRPGTVLPPNPTLYFFNPPATPERGRVDPTKMRARTQSGAPLRMESRKLESMGGLEVFRLDVTAKAGVEFHLEPWSAGARGWRVRADALSNEAFMLTRGKDIFSSWTCSYESLRVLDSSLAAPAYRVEFATTEAALRAGKGQSAVVEGDNDAFLVRSSRSEAPPPPARSVRLGHHDCYGENFSWATSSLAVRVTALLSDGSERKSDVVFVLEAPKR